MTLIFGLSLFNNNTLGNDKAIINKNDLYILQLRDKNYTYAPREAQLRTFSNFQEPFQYP